MTALLLGAGRGSRMGNRPKAFEDLAGRPLLEHSIETVDRCAEVDSFVAAVPAGLIDRALRSAGRSPKLRAIVVGGETRRDSVRAALADAGEAEIVLCHDVARPLASAALFTRVVSALQDADAVVPVVPVHDTVKRVTGSGVVETVPRDELRLAQTPQGFRRDVLERSHAAAESSEADATDDAVLAERAGFRVVAVAGEATNLKVTTPEDLAVVRALLGTASP